MTTGGLVEAVKQWMWRELRTLPQVRQQISALRERLFDAPRWIRQQIPVLREWYYNTSDFDQLIAISAALFMLILPLYLFVPMPPMGAVFTGIFFGTGIVGFLWRERYPALKRWIIETENGQINGTDSYSDEELKQDASARLAPELHWSNRVGFAPPGRKQCCDAACKEVPPPSIGRRVLRILGRIFSYRIFAKWQSLHLTERLYLVAFAMIFLGFVSFRMTGNIFFLEGTILLGYIACSLGFVIWILPWLQKIWHSSVGKLPIMLLNGGC